MCRCCQECLEDLYWNCFEEKFCYDETIANYNPDEDDDNVTKKNGVANGIQSNDNNNIPVCNQPLRRNHYSNISSKIHEEDYRREIQTSVPILAPEILAVFENSQIFQDNTPKLARTHTTKSLLPIIHISDTSKSKETDEEKLIQKLEEGFHDLEAPESTESDNTAIVEEEPDKPKAEIVLRPRLPEDPVPQLRLKSPIMKRPLRSVQSVPFFSVRPASETDIFAISGSDAFSRISMTPEVPSISYSALPKNYEDTPTIEKYRESASLYSIQVANQARAIKEDYSMPRYFGRAALLAQSVDNFPLAAAKEELTPKRHEKSKRLKHLRDSLPPLLIHSVRTKKDEAKQVD